MKTFSVNTPKKYRKKLRKSRKKRHARKTQIVRRTRYGSKKTRRRKRYNNGGAGFFESLSKTASDLSKTASAAASKVVRDVKGAIEVTAYGLVDTSNVKRLHFKNQFFIDYMDIKTIQNLYGNQNLIIKYMNSGDSSDRIGQNGYLASSSSSNPPINNTTQSSSLQTSNSDESSEEEVQGDKNNDLANSETVQEKNKFSEYFKFPVFSKDAVSFNLMNNVEIIDPRCYEKIKKHDKLKDSNKLKYFQSHCIAFRNDRVHNALYEMQYYWKYMLHSMLWDGNDKTKYGVYFLYTEMTKKIINNSELAKKLRSSSYFIKFLNYFHDLFRRSPKKQENATKSTNAEQNPVEDAGNDSDNTPPTAALFEISKLNDFQQVVEQKSAAPLVEQKSAAPLGEQKSAAPLGEQKSAAPLGEQKSADPLAEQKSADPLAEQKSAPSKFNALSANDIITQLRGFFNVPYTIKDNDGKDNIDSFIIYAIENKKYTELPPYYTAIDAKYALYTINEFLDRIINHSTEDKTLVNIIYFQNSQLSTAYNKLFPNATEKKYYPVIVKYEEYPANKYDFFKKHFDKSSDYRESTATWTTDSCNKLIAKIIDKQENIKTIMADFLADKQNYQNLEETKLFNFKGLSQMAINLFLGAADGNVPLLGGGVKERMDNYLEKKKSIIREKYIKLSTMYKSNMFLDLVQCALFQCAANTYRKYIIDPMFLNVVENQQILPLKLYKTLGLYSLRMTNVVCQSPLNRVVSFYDPSGLVKSPHCIQLGFLTSMIREEWSIISPPLAVPATPLLTPQPTTQPASPSQPLTTPLPPPQPTTTPLPPPQPTTTPLTPPPPTTTPLITTLAPPPPPNKSG
jgi:hypothetical protein